MTEYIDEHIRLAGNLTEDDYLAQYKGKLVFRKNIGLALFGIYAFLFALPIMVNIPTFITSKIIEDLLSVNTVGVLSVVISFLFLFYGIKVRSGSSFYELPIICQSLGRRLAPQSTLHYFFGLAGKDESIVNDTISSYVRLNLMKSDSVTKGDIRSLEDSIVSERVRQAKELTRE
jgi:hypothetical protein